MTESGEHSYVQFGPFLIEGESGCLMRGPDPVKLRPMSLQFLRYLAERPGQFVSKEELLERVWAGRVISDSGLRLCVREIRAALGDDAKNPRYLETIVGKGYLFLEGEGGKIPLQENSAPIVGRDDDLLYLGEIFQAAIAGSTQFALLAGEPGIGKTTLLETFLDRISSDHDTNVIQGHGVVHYGKQEAYGPMLEAITSYFQDCDDDLLIRTMERHAPAWLLQLPEMLDTMLFERLVRRTEGMAHERMSREFCQLVAALTETKPLVLVVEDLHWADVATIDLLAALAECSDLSLMILATYRPADAVLYSPSLRNTVRELKGRELCRELLLELLTESDLETYLAGRLNGEISPALVAGLHPRTGGNPLFMVSLIEALVRSHSLVCQEGVWSISDPDKLTQGDIPDSLHSLILRSLEAQSSSRVELLEAASVAGHEFTAAALTDALELSIEQVDSECEGLCADGQFIEPGILVTWPDGTLTGSGSARLAPRSLALAIACSTLFLLPAMTT